MIAPGVGDGERLEDATDRRAGIGAEQEVEMIRRQAVDDKAKGIRWRVEARAWRKTR